MNSFVKEDKNTKYSWIVVMYVLVFLYFLEFLYTLKRQMTLYKTDEKGINFKKAFLFAMLAFFVLRVVGLSLYIQLIWSDIIPDKWFLPFNTYAEGFSQYVFATGFTFICVFWAELYYLSNSSMISREHKIRSYRIIGVVNVAMYIILAVLYILLAIYHNNFAKTKIVHTCEATLSSLRDFCIGLYFLIFGTVFYQRIKKYKSTSNKFQKVNHKIIMITFILTVLFFSNSGFVQWYNYQFLLNKNKSFSISYLIVFTIDRFIFEVLPSISMVYYISHFKSKKKIELNINENVPLIKNESNL
ncbi:tobamovirus multiplication protein 1-like isoform x1 [Anaeramoeba flamelloides]|uniref:Tobamovirus multiplication protein 1-like isoform x1 n=1 Tax=Anaeramoeba flamelloides TaxID=1746091 RepID=A0AAV7Y588_9EUKA|nr:tobamovirus multiplication protein 1-like isoform x1 [Anaeramoeba flamelloides]KAJ6240223.1 tobamovirus multiplication protein 1-like isoform x1 [Anaeramoeba flamelloides]